MRRRDAQAILYGAREDFDTPAQRYTRAAARVLAVGVVLGVLVAVALAAFGMVS